MSKEGIMYTTLFINNEQAIFLMDRDSDGVSRFSAINQAFAVLFDCDEKNILGKTPAQSIKFLPETFVEALSEHTKHTALIEKMQEFEFFLAKKNKYLLVEIRSGHNEKTQTTSIISIIKDITDKKNIELELRERVKELDCLYSLDTLNLEKTEDHQFYQELCGIIKNSWKAPLHTEVQISVHKLTWESLQYKDAPWKLEEKITINNEAAGYIRVVYTGNTSEDPFLKEERTLLAFINKRLSVFLEIQKAEREIKEKNEEYFSLFEEYQSQNEELRAGQEELLEEIQRRTKSETELRKQHEQYLAVYKKLPEIIYVTDPHSYEILFINQNYKELLGYDPSGEKCYKALQGLDEPCPFCTNEILFKQRGEAYIWEHYNQLIDKHLMITDQLIRWPDGRDVRFELAIDISEKKRIISELKEKEERLESYLEQSLIGIALTSAEKKWIQVNNKLCEMTGYTKEELYQMTWENITDPRDIDKELPLFKKLKKGEIKHYEIEKRYITKSNKAIHTKVWNHGFRKNDSLSFVFTLITDITEIKSAHNKILRLNETLEEKVRIRTRKLEEMLHELESFSYSVSHDLRAPLRAITGYTSILEEDFKDQFTEESRAYFQKILVNSERMSQLIDDILSFSKIGRKEIHTVEIDPAQEISEIIDTLIINHPQKKIRIEVGKIPRLLVDVPMIRLVFENLLSNAIKYSSPREDIHIEINCSVHNKELVFSVKDNGIGLDMKYADKIFEVFQRLHPQNVYEGTGVGLAIVKRIIEKHKGRVWVESEPDKGSVFYFSLPEIKKDKKDTVK
jgi:PAS domain S-box-containing protein